VANLRAGVGSPKSSLKAKVNVLNDGVKDTLIGGTGTDWFFGALDDVFSDRLLVGEDLDML
jgi:hypothetical protein